MIAYYKKQIDEITESSNTLKCIMKDSLNLLEIGMTTKEFDDEIGLLFEKHGVLSAPKHFYDFPSNSCISLNDVAAHGIGDDTVITEEDLIKVDISIVHKNGMVADMCRTVYYGTDPRYQNLISYTRKALDAVEESLQPGHSVVSVGKIIEDVATKYGVFVIDSLFGHGVGEHIHEQPTIPHVFNLHNLTNSYKFSVGEIFCVEPMFLLSPTRVYSDGLLYKNGTGAWSTHEEDTYIMTENGVKNLTKFD